MNVAIRLNQALGLNLVSRSKLLKNSVSAFIKTVGEHALNSADVRFAAEKLEQYLDERLIERMTILIYHDDVIAVRISVSIDWETHQFNIVTKGASVVGDQDLVTKYNLRYLTRDLPRFLDRVCRGIAVSDVRALFVLSNEAIQTYGHDGALRRAGLHKLSAEDAAHVRSFTPSQPGHTASDNETDELSYTTEVGMSAPRPSSNRRAR